VAKPTLAHFWKTLLVLNCDTLVRTMLSPWDAGFWDHVPGDFASLSESHAVLVQSRLTSAATALQEGDIDTSIVRTYKKNTRQGIVSPEITEHLQHDGRILIQYDGLNSSNGRTTVTKNFEVTSVARLLRQESEMHLDNRRGYREWEPVPDRNFSRFHRYYNIEGHEPLRLFVDFDQPSADASLMEALRLEPQRFWDAVAAFVAALSVVIPGYDSGYVAVFKSSGAKLSAHIHDLRIWATDVSHFKQLVASACEASGDHAAMLRGIVDTRIYHGSRAWRVPGHCKRVASGSGACRFLALSPDPLLSGKSALEFFALSELGKVGRVAWAAFCFPHVVPVFTLRQGNCVDGKTDDTRKRKAAPDAPVQLKPGQKLVAPWLR
jgi:hypothetical protein